MTSQHWPPPKKMATQGVNFNAHYTSQPAKPTCSQLKAVLTPDPTQSKLARKVIVYSNHHVKIICFVEKLGELLDSEDSLHYYDVLTLVGTQSRDKKAQIIKRFTDKPKKQNISRYFVCH